MTRLGHLALAVAALIALAGCSTADPWEGTELDASGWLACSNLSEQISDAGGAAVAYELGSTQRAPFAAEVAGPGGRSTAPGIADGAVALTRTVDGPSEAWQLALDVTAQTCLDRGYKVS